MKLQLRIAALLLLPILFIGTSSFTWKGDPPMIKLGTLMHDFGKMKAGEKLTYEFPLTNTGDEPLKITSAKSGLDFVIVDWTKDPIKKNGKGVIKVTIDAPGRNGAFTKTILIDSNSSGSTSQVRVTVKALFTTQ